MEISGVRHRTADSNELEAASAGMEFFEAAELSQELID
jgi:hypothetical protein